MHRYIYIYIYVYIYIYIYIYIVLARVVRCGQCWCLTPSRLSGEDFCFVVTIARRELRPLD